MTVYKITLNTLSPIHIGDGNELRQGFDFMVHNGFTYRLDEDAILLAKEKQLIPNTQRRYPTPGELLSVSDFEQPKWFRYRLRGVPRSAKVDARVKTFIKDIHDRPYIPGSSLKGAIRTALAWTGWKEVNPYLDRNAIGRNRSWAGQPLERKLFGPDPNHDLLRALHVSDLFGPTQAGEGLVMVNAQVLTKRNHGSPIELEALPGSIAFTGTMTVDDTLFSSLAERELRFQNRKRWLDELIPRLQSHSRARIQKLLAWYQSAESCDRVAEFYHKLTQVSPGPNGALVQIGWGAGWDGKTFWTHLQTNPQLFEQLVRDFRLHKAGPGTPPRKPGDPFPRSKRVVMKDAVAAAPFGWALLEVNPL